MKTILILKRCLQAAKCSHVSKRLLLTKSYYCEEAWKSRMLSPILQNIDLGDYVMKIQTKFEKEGAVSAVDMDILANTLENIDIQQLDFAQNLFEKHRKSRECLNMRGSTPYGLIRSLLSMNESNRLIQIIQDKIKYGIFPDCYTTNMLLDHFIENKQYQEAAIIAYDQMFQEDFSDGITKMLSWYACHLHWKNPVLIESKIDEALAEGKEDEEDVYIRVDFIERPYYDDHFDIPKDSMKLGKTFMQLGQGTEDIFGRSYTLIGLALYEKYDKGLQFLQTVLETDGANIATEAWDFFCNYLENTETKEPPEEEIELGLLKLEDLYPYIMLQQKEDFVNQLQQIKDVMKSSNKIQDFNLEEHLLISVKESISENEESQIAAQKILFTQWSMDRVNFVEEQVNNYKIIQKKQAIAKRLLELQKKEEKLLYFEEQDRIHLGISKAPKYASLDEVQEEEQFVAAPMERTKGF